MVYWVALCNGGHATTPEKAFLCFLEAGSEQVLQFYFYPGSRIL